jgi:hypothetical protein
MRVERLTAFPIPGVGVGVLAGTVAVGVAVGTTVALGVAVGTIVALGVGVVGGMVDVGLGLAVAVGLGVVVGLTVAVGLGVGVVGVGDGGSTMPQRPLTLNTMCMVGNPIAAVVVGVVIPQSAALR